MKSSFLYFNKKDQENSRYKYAMKKMHKLNEDKIIFYPKIAYTWSKMVEQKVFTDTWPNHTDDSLFPPFLWPFLRSHPSLPSPLRYFFESALCI